MGQRHSWHFSVCGVSFSVLSAGFWVGDGRSGTQFSGGGRPAWFSPVFLCHMADKRASPRLRASLPPVFQFSRPTRRGGWVFSRCRRWVKGNLRRERRGRFFKGRKARGFSTGLLYEEPCRLMLWTFHRLDGQGRGMGPDGMRRWRPRLLRGGFSLVPQPAWLAREGDWPVASLREGRGIGMGQGGALSPWMGRVGFPGFLVPP